MRPVRAYTHTFIRELQTDPDTPTQLLFDTTGNTPCVARRHAYNALEKKLREENLPRNGWKLVSQQLKGLVASSGRPI